MSAAGILTAPPDLPETSSLDIVALDALDSGPVALAIQHWNALKGGRRFPAREDISPRDMAPFLRHVVMIRVIDAGADFEYRIVGDAHVQAQAVNFGGYKLSEIEASNPGYNPYTRPTYCYVVATGEAFAMRGWVGRDVPHSAFSYHETVFLPLGRSDAVDHILVVTNYRPRTGQDFKPAIVLPRH